MTAGQFGEVDLDLLADYVGGALEGTPDEAAVARLVAEDPSWSRAHAALALAVGEVRTNLAEWADRPEPMPPDVLDRLDAALSSAGTLDPTGSSEDADEASPHLPADRSARRLALVPGAADGGGRPARRRWARWVGPAAVAAAVAAFAGFAGTQLVGGGSAQDAAGSAAYENSAPVMPKLSEPPRALAESSAERLLATGTDYARQTIADSLAGLAQPSGTPQSASRYASSPAARSGPAASGSGPVAPGLARLAGQAARAACLDAVAAAHAAGPVQVDLVDYAAFEGSPALVVSFVDQGGERWAWVVGPDCGQPRSGADTRFTTRVG